MMTDIMLQRFPIIYIYITTFSVYVPQLKSQALEYVDEVSDALFTFDPKASLSKRVLYQTLHVFVFRLICFNPHYYEFCSNI